MSSSNQAISHSEVSPSSTIWADRLVRAFMRHWLVLLMLPLLIFVSLPFLAPAAMNAGWTGVGNLLYKVYTPFCHQLPQRSWFLFGEKLTYSVDEIGQVYPYSDAWRLRFFNGTPEMGWKVAWSDRMVSFYFLVPVFGLLYALLRQTGRAIRPIPLWLLILTLLPLTIDGGTHMVNDLIYGVSGGGFRDTNAWLALLTGNAFPALYAGDHLGTFNWWMRLFTGLLAACGLAFWTFPWFDHWVSAEVVRYETLQEQRHTLDSAAGVAAGQLSNQKE